MHTRNSDPPVKIVREIPLTWLIGGAILLVFHGGLTLSKLNRLEENQERYGQSLEKVATQVQQVTATLSLKDLKDNEQDFQIKETLRRISEAESNIKDINYRIGPPPPYNRKSQ